MVRVADGKVKPGFVVSPNPAEGGVINLQFKNQLKGKYIVRLLSIIGQGVSGIVATHAGGNSTHMLNLSSSIGHGTYKLEIIAPDKTRTTKTVAIRNR